MRRDQIAPTGSLEGKMAASAATQAHAVGRRTTPSGARLAYWALLIVTAVVAGVGVVRYQLASAYTATAPERAIEFNPRQVDALAELARRRYLQGEVETAERLARAAQRESPLDAASLRVLGWAASLRGDEARARAMMETAGARSWRDTGAQYWLWEEYVGRGQPGRAAVHLDAFMRLLPEERETLYPEIARWLETPGAAAALAERLALDPSWRGELLAGLASQADFDSRLPVLFSALKRAGSPPTASELTPFLEQMIRQGRYAEALGVLREVYPPGAYEGHLFDPEFSGGSGAPPFGWRLKSGVGYNASAEAAPLTKARRLLAEYDGFSSPDSLAEQLVVLPPGRIRLSGEYFIEQGDPTPLSWTVTCADSGEELGRLNVLTGPVGRWTRFETKMWAPARSCAAQWLRLQAEPGDRRSAVRIWFGALRFDRLSQE